eukprot:Gregarina_sp_Poly_1__1151@NODE_1280_length_4510_cov_54_898267_g867_i0_p2_GENE_NODE_1280_length_4510_cov_54_898267_g867_i0NODE_1280_length_4510_cov_54_898267_g867_i0_p2_ORF_typecomplete_len128_score12_71SRP921/PF05486_12/3_3e17SRP921/PF05486_12/4_9e03PB1/PF00564_24/0_078_NODE_1280_length_4510_cov_54_898267_g867_i0501884
MVYIQNWSEFEAAVRSLYLEEPHKTRYEIKYRPSDGDVIVKVTDDRTCLQFRARNAQHIRRIDVLTTAFFAWSVQPRPKTLADLEDLTGRTDLPSTPKIADEKKISNSTRSRQRKKKGTAKKVDVAV